MDTHITAGAVAEVGGQSRYYIASLDRMVYAYSVGGQRLWKARMVGPVYAVATLPGGRVAAGDDSGVVALFDSSGAREWSYSLGTRVTSLSGALPEGLLAGGWDARLTLLALVPGQERVLWHAQLGDRVTSIAALPGLAVVSTARGEIRAFGPGGESLWSAHAGAPVTRLTTSRICDASGGEKDVVLAGVQDGRLIEYGADGSLHWQVDLGEGSPVWATAPLGTGEECRILACSGNTHPFLASLTGDGEWVWQLPLPGTAGAIAVLDLDADGSSEIFVGMMDGRILAYDREGGLRASAQAGLPVWDLLADGSQPSAGGLVLADLNAWRLVAEDGAAVAPRLQVPDLLPWAVTALPAAAIRLEAEAPRDGAVLAFLGDLVPGRSMELQIDRHGPAYPWSGLRTLLDDADLSMANLECVLSTQGVALNKRYVIRAHPEAAETLVAGGLDLVTLANNHTLDFGASALADTLSALQQAGIAAVGAGSTAQDARRPALFELNGVKVAILAYAGAYWKGSADVPDSDLVAWGDPARVAADVRAVRDQADIVVVVLHAGKEYSRTPTDTQTAVSHAAIDAGANLVVGHHPHVTQTVERYRGGLIVYSLGNALFDIQQQAAMQGNLLRVLVTRDGLAQAELWPFWIEGDIRPRLIDDGQGMPKMDVVYP